jgi:hypothetical protein
MSFNNIPPSSLSRFSVGEITQLMATPFYYNAGSSKWLKTGSYTAASNLSTTAKNNLAAASTALSSTIALVTASEASLTSAYPYSPLPAQRISASGVTVFPGCSGTTTPIVTTVTSAGAQNISLPITANFVSAAAGGNIVVASNNTTIFAYTATAGSTFGAVSTTDGLNWSLVTLTGLPTTLDLNNVRAFSSGQSCTVGVNGRSKPKDNRLCVFWCGARFILVVADGTSTFYVTATSTDGIAWTSNTTLTVLGSVTIASTATVDFYRNGNNCYLCLAGNWRKSTDGGVSWSACASTPYSGTADKFQKLNSTDAAKLMYTADTATTSYFSADSGATWTSRTLPIDSSGAIAYRGSTVLISKSNTGVYRSVNDGASFTSVVFPVGTLSSSGLVFSDASRFYFVPQGQPQILTSTDAITWTIVSVPANSMAIQNGAYQGGIIYYDSNNVILLGYNSQSGFDQCAITNDGGATWKNSSVTNLGSNTDYTFVGDAFVSPDGLGGGTAAFGGTNGGAYYGGTSGNVCSKTTAVAGGGFYRTGSAVVTPTNANAVMFARIE